MARQQAGPQHALLRGGWLGVAPCSYQTAKGGCPSMGTMGSCVRGPVPISSASEPPCWARTRTTHWVQWDASSTVQPQGSALPAHALPPPTHQAPASDPQGRASLHAMCAALHQVQACLPPPGCPCSRAPVPCQAPAASAAQGGREPRAPARARPFPAPQTRYATRAWLPSPR